MEGLIHIYTGNGNGKTTAALGLAIRFAGCGGKAVIVQFCKGSETGELESLSRIPGITVLRNSRDYGFWSSCTKQQQELVRLENNANISQALSLVGQGESSLLVLDEVMFAYSIGAVDAGAVDNLLNRKPKELELVLTGRDAPEHFLVLADYISEIKCIRHPYEKGIVARRGIEF